eukprot:506720_1
MGNCQCCSTENEFEVKQPLLNKRALKKSTLNKNEVKQNLLKKSTLKKNSSKTTKADIELLLSKYRESKDKLPSSLVECNNHAILYLFKNFINDDKIDLYKERMISYIKENTITGQQIMQIERRKFSENVIQHFDDQKISIAAVRTHDKLVKFDFNTLHLLLPLHRFGVEDICKTIKEWINKDMKNKTDFMLRLNNNKNNNINKTKLLEKTSVKNNFSEDSMNRLFKRLREDKVNGIKFMELVLKKKLSNMIKTQTGWDDKDIEQLKLTLLKHRAFTIQQFTDNMNNVFANNSTLPNIMKNEIIKSIMDDEFDIELIHYNIKNNKNIEKFSDKMVNLVEALVEKNNEENKQNNESETNLVYRIYGAIAQCFVYNDDSDLLCDKPRDWICTSCGNYNFHKFIDGKINYDVSICILCGISQIGSIIAKIRNLDSFLMNDSVEYDDKKKDNEDDNNIDAYNDLLNIAAAKQIDLACSCRNDSQPCLSMLRLSKQLTKYKEWLQNNHNNDINKTIEVDILTFVDNEAYKTIFVDNAKSIPKIESEQMKVLISDQNIVSLQEFCRMNRKTFVTNIKKLTGIKPAVSVKLYKKINLSLKVLAQIYQWGKLSADITKHNIDQDYHHILKWHIEHGNQNSIKNTFRFFSTVVHYEDESSQAAQCVSIKRVQKTEKELNSQNIMDTKTPIKRDNNIDTIEDRNIWKFNQYYYQSQLDMMHSYLVHTEWQTMVARYAYQEDTKDDKQDEAVLIETKSELPPTRDDKLSEFGFGIGYYHPDLAPKYKSTYHELIFNKLWKFNETMFCNLLTKAIRKHEVALVEYAELYCKYYDYKYNIIRNEQIGIAHIFSIIVYTDMSQFCKNFRQTYRKKK